MLCYVLPVLLCESVKFVNFQVVDMQGVFDVMAILERYPITKEHLEVRVDLISSVVICL